MRMGAIWPQPMLAATQFGITAAHAHLSEGSMMAGSSGGHAMHAVSPTGAGGHIDASAGARAVQQQLANVRMRAAGGD